MAIPESMTPESELAYAKEILARLERYAAATRSAAGAAPAAAPPPPPVAPLPPPPPKHPMATATAPRDDILPTSVPYPRTDGPPTQPPEPERDASERRRFRIDPATIDLFPYDLAASIVACALIIVVNIAFNGPVAVVFAAALAGAGEWMRRTRWFPSVGVKLMIGTVVGLVLVLTA
jgi:hypothetical protein